MNTTAAVPETASLPLAWPESKDTFLPTPVRVDHSNLLADWERSPALRMLEQTIVCLHELDRTGNLTLAQKIELADLVTRHNQALGRPKLGSVGVGAA